jgi:hypothetical protein
MRAATYRRYGDPSPTGRSDPMLVEDIRSARLGVSVLSQRT